MTISEWLKANWWRITQIIMLGVLIYLVVIENINIRCRIWCKKLVEPYINACSGVFGNFSNMNYSDFEDFIRNFNKTK